MTTPTCGQCEHWDAFYYDEGVCEIMPRDPGGVGITVLSRRAACPDFTPQGIKGRQNTGEAAMNEHQAMTDAELADHIAFLKEAKEGIEKQIERLAHPPWNSIPYTLASLGGDNLLVREYRRLNETLQKAEAEQAKRGRVI